MSFLTDANLMVAGMPVGLQRLFSAFIVAEIAEQEGLMAELTTMPAPDPIAADQVVMAALQAVILA
jgi:hypothetical protein